MQYFPAPPAAKLLPVAIGETQLAFQAENDSALGLKLTPKQPKAESTSTIIRKATLNDIYQIHSLYKIVAQVHRGNLTQEEDEITLDYISEVLKNGLALGLIIVLEKEQKIIGYLKAFTSRFRCLAHVLTNATMMVHPEWQNRGYGGQLIDTYLEQIQSDMSHILRFELLPHQSNQEAIQFYERHGFVRESQAFKKIRNAKAGFENEVVLVWFNPNFSEEALKKYLVFLKSLR